MAQRAGKSQATYFALTGFALLGVIFYLYADGYFDAARNLNRAVRMENGMLVLSPSRDGHYRASGTIDGVPVTFLLDTGATGIAINREVARKAHLTPRGSVEVATANGRVRAQLTRIAEIRFAQVTVHDLAAVIMPDMDEDVLLGMRFLQAFDWLRENDRLILKSATQE